MTAILPPNLIDSRYVKTSDHIKPSALIKNSWAEVLFTVNNFFSVYECQSWIQYCNSVGFTEVNSNESYEFAKRKQGRLQMDLNETASAIFHRLHSIIPPDLDGRRAVGCSSNIRIYRYLPGQCFGKHIDESNIDPQGRGATQLTVLVYLNGEEGLASSKTQTTNTNSLSGGNTVFYRDVSTISRKKSAKKEPEIFAVITPVAGKVLVHAHGRRCLTHEAAAVVQGVKYVLRTDVVYG